MPLDAEFGIANLKFQMGGKGKKERNADPSTATRAFASRKKQKRASLRSG
jgi:hypothetical protein